MTTGWVQATTPRGILAPLEASTHRCPPVTSQRAKQLVNTIQSRFFTGKNKRKHQEQQQRQRQRTQHSTCYHPVRDDHDLVDSDTAPSTVKMNTAKYGSKEGKYSETTTKTAVGAHRMIDSHKDYNNNDVEEERCSLSSRQGMALTIGVIDIDGDNPPSKLKTVMVQDTPLKGQNVAAIGCMQHSTGHNHSVGHLHATTPSSTASSTIIISDTPTTHIDSTTATTVSNDDSTTTPASLPPVFEIPETPDLGAPPRMSVIEDRKSCSTNIRSNFFPYVGVFPKSRDAGRQSFGSKNTDMSHSGVGVEHHSTTVKKSPLKSATMSKNAKTLSSGWISVAPRYKRPYKMPRSSASASSSSM